MLIETKVLGSRKRPYEPWEIPLLQTTETLTLKDFLTRVVRQEVEAFKNRQEERKLVRVLSKEEIEAGVTKGKIDSGGLEHEPQDVDPVAAVENALLAFKDGFYYVFVDEKQALNLEEEIRLEPDSRVLFLRLVPLVGG